MSFIFAVLNAINQRKDSQYVRQVALEVSGQARTTDQMSTVIALRDYVRKHVSRAQYPARGRPYLRDTAADILRSGKGRCGEATRAFIGLAETFGIPAQRLYLEGQRRHVVALVTLDRGERLIRLKLHTFKTSSGSIICYSTRSLIITHRSIAREWSCRFRATQRTLDHWYSILRIHTLSDRLRGSYWA